MGIVCRLHGRDHSMFGEACNPSKPQRNADKPVVTLKHNAVTKSDVNVTLPVTESVTRNAYVMPNVTPVTPTMTAAQRQKAYRDRKRTSQT